jgi:uncharacterized membrane protein
MNAKSLLQSKTFWVQVIAFIAALFPVVREWIARNPETTIAVLGAVNILVRFATSGRVTLFQEEAPGKLERNEDENGKPSGGAALLVLMTCAAAVLMGGLPPRNLVAETQDFKTQDARADSPIGIPDRCQRLTPGGDNRG